MGDLQEVRRYWPRAKRSKSGARFWAPGELVHLTLIADVWEVDFGSGGELPPLKYIGQTIPEAMHAAGFGARPLGEYASKLKRTRKLLYMQGSCAMIATIDWPPLLADTQRPHKGARLGRRKRLDYGIGEKWYGLFPGAGARCARQGGVRC